MKKSNSAIILSFLSIILFALGFLRLNVNIMLAWAWLGGIVMAVIGLVVSIVAYKEDKCGKAIAGIVVSSISLLLNVILFCSCGLCSTLLM